MTSLTSSPEYALFFNEKSRPEAALVTYFWISFPRSGEL